MDAGSAANVLRTLNTFSRKLFITATSDWKAEIIQIDLICGWFLHKQFN